MERAVLYDFEEQYILILMQRLESLVSFLLPSLALIWNNDHSLDNSKSLLLNSFNALTS